MTDQRFVKQATHKMLRSYRHFIKKYVASTRSQVAMDDYLSVPMEMACNVIRSAAQQQQLPAEQYDSMIESLLSAMRNTLARPESEPKK